MSWIGGRRLKSSFVGLGLRFPVKKTERYLLRKEDCTGCLKCESACPTRAIRIDTYSESLDLETESGRPVFWGLTSFELNYAQCLKCDICINACPEAALEKGFGEIPSTSQPINLKVDLLKRQEPGRRG